MKKIMLILISVIMLFAACENRTENAPDSSAETSVNTAPTQIDPAEEFDGVLFGMTKDEIINALGTKPLFDGSDYLSYYDVVFLGVDNASVEYDFTDEGKLNRIFITYNCLHDSEKDTSADYAAIKEELLKYYPENTRLYVTEYDYGEHIEFATSNRKVTADLIASIPVVEIWGT